MPVKMVSEGPTVDEVTTAPTDKQVNQVLKGDQVHEAHKVHLEKRVNAVPLV